MSSYEYLLRYSNASSVNYLDQYRMQQILPGAPASSAAARPDPLRQSIESSINKTMVRVFLSLPE